MKETRRTCEEHAKRTLQSLSDPAAYRAWYEDAQSDSGQVRAMSSLTMVFAAWAQHGLQTVTMPATYEAALISTDSSSAMEGEHLPWPSFAIEINSDVFKGSRVDAFLVIVAEAANGAIFFVAADRQRRSCLMFVDDLAELSDPAIDAKYKEEHERLRIAIGRLVCGVVLAVNQHRESGGNGGERPLQGQRSTKSDGTLWRIGKPLSIDCRQAVRDFLAGNRRGPLSTKHLRRGHWRMQTHGPGHALRRRQWIHPCWVGEGPTLVRPVIIGSRG